MMLIKSTSIIKQQQVIVNSVQIPPLLQDNVTPLLPVQPRSLDQEPPPTGHLSSQGIDSTHGNDDVEQQAEDMLMFSSPFSMILESPQATDESSIYQFSESSEVYIQ